MFSPDGTEPAPGTRFDPPQGLHRLTVQPTPAQPTRNNQQRELPMTHQPLRTPEQQLAAAKRGLGLPVVVAICGSTRFMEQMAAADLEETASKRIVVKPGCDLKKPHLLWADPDRAERLKEDLDELHRAKIRLADEVLVVGDYIGDSTRSEVRYARALGLWVRFTHPGVDPDPVSLPESTYELRTVGSTATISLPSVVPVPGLHVYELPEHLREAGDGVANPWRLGHHSGLALAAFPCKEDALRGAREIADLTDWTRSAEDIRTDPSFDMEDYADYLTGRTNALLVSASMGREELA